jgi:transposase
MDNRKYVGMDIHKSITVIAVMNAAGQIESRAQVLTKAESLCDFLRGQRGPVQVALEEGTQSAWLYQVLKPLVERVIVFDARTVQRRGSAQKSDDKDAENIARLLRLGDLQPIYKGDPAQQQLKELCQTYDNLVSDTTRTKNRIKALFRARGIACAGQTVYRTDKRDEYLHQLPEEAARFRATSLFAQLAGLQTLRKQAKQRFVQQARQHPDFAYLTQLPGFGDVRAGQLLAIIGTPQRFRTKRQLWPYAGLSVVTHSTADYRSSGEAIVKAPKKVATRGLNRNHHPQLKQVFKGAALSALAYPEIRAYYDRLVEQGTRAALARVSLARKLAAITLTLWQRREDYDAAKAFPTGTTT